MRRAGALLFSIVLGACGGEGMLPSPADDGVDAARAVDAGSTIDLRQADAGTEAARPDTTGASEVGADAMAGADATAAACPPQGPLELGWVTSYQREVMARLSGEQEAEPGITLPNRGTPVNRATAARYLEKALRDLGLEPASHRYGTGVNVFAHVPSTTGGGEHVEEHVILGAHYDTVVRSPGANDNATGVVLVLAVGKALAAITCRSRPVTLVLFDEEEEGLVGSGQYARKLVAEKTRVHSVHTADQLGWDANGDRLIELERPDTGLRELYEAAMRSLGESFPLVNTNTPSSDHSSFRPMFKAVGLTEGYRNADTTPHMHRATDTTMTVDFGYLRTATVLVARTMADLVR